MMRIVFTLIDMTHKKKDLTVTTWSDVVRHQERPTAGDFIIVEKVIFDYMIRRMKEGYVISNMEVKKD